MCKFMLSSNSILRCIFHKSTINIPKDTYVNTFALQDVIGNQMYQTNLLDLFFVKNIFKSIIPNIYTFGKKSNKLDICLTNFNS